MLFRFGEGLGDLAADLGGAHSGCFQYIVRSRFGQGCVAIHKDLTEAEHQPRHPEPVRSFRLRPASRDCGSVAGSGCLVFQAR